MCKYNLNKYLSFAVVTTLLLTALCGCANVAMPSGGPKDETPPVFLSSNPTPNSLQVDKRRLVLDFDEVVLVQNPSEKVMVSPPQTTPPVVRANGHKVSVELKDSLLPHTTYTIDFSDAIVDNNENNPLPNFSLAFSTGEVIDTMQISGRLLNAVDLEPITGMMVGIQRNLADSAFTTQPLDRIGVSDAYGKFTIRNITPGSYRLFALKDGNRNFLFDTPTEDIAFMDSTVTTSMEIKIHTKRVPNPNKEGDTLTVEHPHPHYYPNDLVLRVFNEEFKTQYLENSERKERNQLKLLFSAPADTLPHLTPLNFETEEWAVIEKSATNDTLTYWITDSLVVMQDTLLIEAQYLRTDSLQQLSSYTDTLKLIYRQPKASRAKKVEAAEGLPTSTRFVGLRGSAQGTIDLDATITLTFDEPVALFDTSMVVLEQRVDTLWQRYNYTLTPDTNNIRQYTLSAQWQSEREYRIGIDSARVQSIYGAHNNRFESTFKSKLIETYANLYIRTMGLNTPDSAFVELLNEKDVVVKRAPVTGGGAELLYLTPGEYYARLVVDTNGNGKFDTGNYSQRLQPEMVYYNPNKFSLKANWDVEQEWDVLALPIEKQKPRKITKNRPKEELEAEREAEKNAPKTADPEDDFVLPF